MLSVDLNSDVGEDYPNDEELMSWISSANIACGAHAGSADTMRRTVELAIKHNVAIGAHPSYPDKENFGRVDLIGLRLKAEDLPRIITDQLTRIQKICSEFRTRLHHVKLHGALYNRAAWDAIVSLETCKCLSEFDSSLILYGLSGSQMEKQADLFHIKFVSEVFADRTYREDGSLTPRGDPNAQIEDVGEVAARALKMVLEGTVTSVSGKVIAIKTGTICIHGDGVHALHFAKAIQNVLNARSISIHSPLNRIV